METVVFHSRKRPETFERLKSFVVVQLHCDHTEVPKKEFALGLQEKLTGEPTQPTYVVFDPRTETVLGRWAYSIDHDLWVRRLDAGLAAYRERTP